MLNYSTDEIVYKIIFMILDKQKYVYLQLVLTNRNI